jgi:hypothetical protein
VIDFLLDNPDLLSHVVSQESCAAKYFLLDLLYYCYKQRRLQGVSLARKRKRTSLSTDEFLISAVEEIAVPCQHEQMSAVEAQTCLKACDALIYLVQSADSEERCTRVIGVVAKVAEVPLPKKFDKLGLKECYLVDVGAMARLSARRKFTLVILALNRALRYEAWSAALTCATCCHQVYLQSVSKSALARLLAVLSSLSEADDDLIEALLGLSESELRLERLREGQATAVVSAMPVFTLGSPLSMSLSAVLFLWFLLDCTCSDARVLLDMLMSPETRAREYCLRGTKALLAGHSAAHVTRHIEALNKALAESASPPTRQEDEEGEVTEAERPPRGAKVAVWGSPLDREQDWVAPQMWQWEGRVEDRECEQMRDSKLFSLQSLANYCLAVKLLLSNNADLSLLASRFQALHVLLST